MHERDAERIALGIFKTADKASERITLGTVERRPAELAGHPPGHCPPSRRRAEESDRQADWHQSFRLITGCQPILLCLCNLAGPVGPGEANQYRAEMK